jgi:nucleoside 2-deoxyribosyltransferase
MCDQRCVSMSQRLSSPRPSAPSISSWRALESDGHQVYLPQRDTPATEAPDRTTTVFYANLAALRKADALVAVCDGSQVDDGAAWEIGYAYGKNIQIFGLRTDVRIVQRADESINLMILESLGELVADDRAAGPHDSLRRAAVTNARLCV